MTVELSHADEAAAEVGQALGAFATFCGRYVDAARALDGASLNVAALHHHEQSRGCVGRGDFDAAQFHHHVGLLFAAHGLVAAAAAEAGKEIQ